MEKERLPRLTEAHVRELADGQSFERGKSYYRDGRIIEPVRQGMELRAECQGSQYEPYRVIVNLTEDGIEDVSCTCPRGGFCKHIVALLLTYIHEPQAFRVIPPLQVMLAKCSKEELIVLIDEMVRREPDLMSLIELSVSASKGSKIDTEPYRRQVRRMLRWEDPSAIEGELHELCRTADRLAKSGDWLNAGSVYHVVLSETINHYPEELHMMDENGEISIIIDDLAKGLGKCLEKSNPDDETRRRWLEALLEAEITDTNMGGIELAPSAWKAILEHATDKEWDWIEGRLRTEIERSWGWKREVLVDRLRELYEHKGDDEQSADLIRELGTDEQKAFLLVKEGEIDKAMRLIRQIVVEKPGLVTQFADALVSAGADSLAIELVMERMEEERRSSWYIDWLANYYKEHGNAQEALDWQKKLFFENPSVEKFKTLRDVSNKVGVWEQVRAEVLKRLESKKQIGVLIEIALHEKNVKRALELLPRVDKSDWMWQNYRLEVAKSAERDYPKSAIEIYKQMAEQAIEMRHRSAYQQAIQYLERVKALYKGLNMQAEWEDYIQTVRAQYAKLRALQDEMIKARL